jgi:hypothetical protein
MSLKSLFADYPQDRPLRVQDCVDVADLPQDPLRIHIRRSDYVAEASAVPSSRPSRANLRALPRNLRDWCGFGGVVDVEDVLRVVAHAVVAAVGTVAKLED